MCYGVLAGYATAKLAPQSPVAHGFIFGLLGTASALVVAINSWIPNPVAENWYEILLVLTFLPTVWIGAKLASVGF